VRRTLLLGGRVQELARTLQHEQNIMLFGRGQNYATALEAALKVREPWHEISCYFVAFLSA
jgi:glucosamine--fructose-6-phosphate aminotransferase (isomerizing)